VLSASARGGRDLDHALRDTASTSCGTDRARLQWANQHRLCGTGESDPPTEHRRLGAPDMVDGTDDTAALGPSGVVAGLVSLRAASRIITCDDHAAGRSWWRTDPAALSATDARDGGGTDTSALDRTGPIGSTPATNAARCSLMVRQHGPRVGTNSIGAWRAAMVASAAPTDGGARQKRS
jgi:hypothetical protein